MANAVYRRMFDGAFVTTSAEKPIRRDVFQSMGTFSGVLHSCGHRKVLTWHALP